MCANKGVLKRVDSFSAKNTEKVHKEAGWGM